MDKAEFGQRGAVVGMRLSYYGAGDRGMDEERGEVVVRAKDLVRAQAQLVLS